MVARAELNTESYLTVDDGVNAIKRGFGYNDKKIRTTHLHQGFATICIGGVVFKIVSGASGGNISADIPKKNGWTVPAALVAIARVIGGVVFYDFDDDNLPNIQRYKSTGNINQIKHYQS